LVDAIEKRDDGRQHRTDSVSLGVAQLEMILVRDTLQIFFLGLLDCHRRHLGISNLQMT
jgi:hypothetical protein